MINSQLLLGWKNYNKRKLADNTLNCLYNVKNQVNS